MTVIKFNKKFSVSRLSFIPVLMLTSAALAVSPEVWQSSSEADFSKCERDAVVVNSHGDVTLARKIEIILSSADAPAVVSAVAVEGDNIYAASGTDGWIYKITPTGKQKTDIDPAYKVEKFAELPAAMVTCLVRKGKTLLAGGGGTNGGIYAIQPNGQIKKVFAEDVVKYVWAILVGPKGTLYAATGPEGLVYSVDANGKGEVLYHMHKKLARNILCLAMRENGKLLAGTDQSGLIIEIDPATKLGRVILDASEKEISAIIVDGKGGLFASTSDAGKAGATSQPSGSKNGKAESTPDRKPADESDEKSTAKPAKEEKTPATQPAEKQKQPAKENSTDKNKTKKLKLIGLPEDQAAKSPGQWKKLPVDDKITKADIMALVKNNSLQNSNSTNNNTAPKPSATKISDVAKAALAAAMKRKSSTTHKPSGKGNAVYHIDSRGMYRTIFRKPVTILAMLSQGDRLILATGQEGKVYFVTKDGTLSGELVDTDAKQVTAIIETPPGDLVFATSNKGSVGRIGNRFAASGTLTSKPSDAKQIAQWGTIKLLGVAPDNTKITVATRSGNIQETDDSTWSSWSRELPLETGYLQIGSPAARFLQYRVTFESDGKVTPSLGQVEIIYQVGNLAPAVLGVAVKASEKGLKPTDKAITKAFRLVGIQAFDPNKDKLKYTIDFRQLRSAAWVEITNSLNEPKFAWDTRTVADGLYELRVTASDEPSNIPAAALQASRVSEPITVDNTAPALQKINATVNNQQAKVTGQAVDAMSRIVAMQFAVDSVDEWTTILPTDGICDSTTEAFQFETDELKPGPHRIAIKAIDIYGNTGYSGVNVTIEK